MPRYSATGAPLVDEALDRPADLPDLLEARAAWVDRRSVPSFATQAARNAALAGLGPADTGRLCTTRSPAALWFWSGSSWQTTFEASGGAWLTYQPLLLNFDPATNQEASLSVGNGTLSGRYRFVGPKTIMWTLTLTRGTSTDKGTALYRFTLPPTAPLLTHRQVGSALVMHNSAQYGAAVRPVLQTRVSIVRADGPGPNAAVGSGSSSYSGGGYFARTTFFHDGDDWAAGDEITASATWELQ